MTTLLHVLHRRLARLFLCEFLGSCASVVGHNGDRWLTYCPRCLRTHGGAP